MESKQLSVVFKALHDLAAACYLIMFSISVILSFHIFISSGEHTRSVDFRISVPTRSLCLGGSFFLWPAPPHSHLGSNVTLSEVLPHGPLWKYSRHAPRSWAGVHCRRLFPTPSHVSHLKSAMAGVFTPKKLTNITNEGSAAREPVVEFLPAHQCLLLSCCLCTTHAFLIFLVASIPLKTYIFHVLFICLLTLSFRYNPKRAESFSKLLFWFPWPLDMCMRTSKIPLERMNLFHRLSLYYVSPQYLRF